MKELFSWFKKIILAFTAALFVLFALEISDAPAAIHFDFNDAVSQADNWTVSAPMELTQNSVSQSMPLPTSKEVFSYLAVETPLRDATPSSAKPIGVGTVAGKGNTYSLKVDTGQFESPVDLYLAYYYPAKEDKLYFIDSANHPTQTFVPWKTGATSAAESLFGDVDISSWPGGTYYVALLALPSGGDSYYLWITAIQGRVSVDAVEVTQTVQSLDNDVPMIAGKRAFVRLYLHSEGFSGDMRNITGYLTAYGSGGEKLPIVAPSLNNLNVGLLSDTVSKRKRLEDSLNFELPDDWTYKGAIRLILGGFEVNGKKLNISCAGCELKNNSTDTGLFLFQEAPPVRVKLVKVSYSTDGGKTYLEPRKEDFDSVKSWLRRAFPANLGTDTGDRMPVLTYSNGEPDCNAVNSDLEKLRTNEIKNGLEDPVQPSHYYGLIYAENNNNFRRGCAQGMPSYIASGPAGPPNFWGDIMNWDSDISFGGWYAGHELAHTYGRWHPGYGDCLGSQKPDDHNYPYTNGLIGGSDLKYFGFDAGDKANAMPYQRIYDPTIWTDVMTYRCKEWISNYTYRGILEQLNKEVQTNLHTPAPRLPDTTEAIHILGTINLTRNTVELNTFTRLSSFTLSTFPGASSFNISLLSASGGTLAAYPFDPKLPSDSEPDADNVGMIAEVVPLPAGTNRIEILRDGKTLASRVISTQAPVVTLTYPNGGESLTGDTANVTWQASAANGYTLIYSLLYSPDAGKTWQYVISNLQAPAYQVNLATLPGSAAALFRVIASDGVNEGKDDTDAAFQVPFKTPAVNIITPADSSIFLSTQIVSFRGMASDLQDGNIEGEALQWSSDIQGILGFGQSFASKLKPGKHTITLTAKNSHGLTGKAYLPVEVTEINAENLMPLPAGQQMFIYSAISSPVKSALPEEAAPIGIGPIAAGGNRLGLRVGLQQFAGPVDFYLLFFSEANQYLLLPDLSLRPLSEGFAAWKAGTSGPVDEPLPLNLAGLPKGIYHLAFLAVPSGGGLSGPYYLWGAFAGLNITPLTLSAITPVSGAVGNTITLTGAGFGTTKGTVSFNGTTATIVSWSDAEIKTIVPPGATTGNVLVTTSNGTVSNGVMFTVTTTATSKYTDNGNGTVTDKTTGLTWQQGENSTRFRWYQASGTYDATYNPSTQSVCGSLSLAGGGWRLPTKTELESLIDNSVIPLGTVTGPHIDTNFFPNAYAYYYWSSTAYAGAGYTTGYAWSGGFLYGMANGYNKTASLYVRCVRP